MWACSFPFVCLSNGDAIAIHGAKLLMNRVEPWSHMWLLISTGQDSGD